MSALSKQEAQNLINNAKNQILSGTASRQDVQTVTENSRDRVIGYMHDFLTQNQQQFFRELQFRNQQYKDRLTAMEHHINSIEQEFRSMRQQIDKMAGNQPQRVIVPMAQEQIDAVQDQYGFNPAR